jgi:hypothetical protein
MKRLMVFFIFIFLVIEISKAQVQPQYLQDAGQYGKTLESNTSVDIQGNPYFFEGWNDGLASLTKGGAQLRISKLRYNVLKERGEFDNNGRIMFLDPEIFSQIILINGADSLVFRNKIDGIKSVSTASYLQIGYEGKNLWVIKPIKNLVNDPEATYGSTKKKLIQSDESFFVIKSNKEVISFKMSNRSITKSFGVQSKSLTDFLKNKGYSLDNPQHYKWIFAWLDNQL